MSRGGEIMIEFDLSDENIKRTIKGNYFDRNKYLSKLIKYVLNADNQESFALNGEWGSGKTVFLHQFMCIAKDTDLASQIGVKDYSPDELEVYYYNAWENELMNRPSIALLNSISREYKIIDEEDKDNTKMLFQKVANIAIKLGSAGALNIDDFIRTSDDLNIKDIQMTFHSVIDYILKKKKCRRVTIIIDELDRCKPTNVIRLLEEIKHFYNHNALTFIFSADLKQLGNTIRKMYGECFDAELYIQRFFDATFSLNSSSYEKYINEELSYNITETHIINEISKIAISFCKLSIRETNKYVKKLKVIGKEIGHMDSFDKDISIAKCVFVPWGIALKIRDISKYEEFMSGSLPKTEIEKFIEYSPEIPSWLTNYYVGRNNDSNEFDITSKIYEIYISIFRGKSFKYLREDYNNSYLRNSVIPYIEF